MTIKFENASRIYLDTNIWIYFVEGHPAFGDSVAAIFNAAHAANVSIMTSEITIAECLIKPSRERDQGKIDAYTKVFASTLLDLIPLDGLLTRRAALEGGPLGLKLIDAIHFASAREAGCRYFVTGDGRFQSVPDLEVIGLT